MARLGSGRLIDLLNEFLTRPIFVRHGDMVLFPLVGILGKQTLFLEMMGI